MPGSLWLRNKDPNGKGRGKGIYYHRGNGVWSKYQIGPNSRDAKIKAKGWRKSKTGVNTKGKPSRIAHAGDGVKGR